MQLFKQLRDDWRDDRELLLICALAVLICLGAGAAFAHVFLDR